MVTMMRMIQELGTIYPNAASTRWSLITLQPEDHYVEEENFFFIFRDGTPVCADQFRLVLKIAISDSGLEQDNYNTHSLRIVTPRPYLKLDIWLRRLKRWKGGNQTQFIIICTNQVTVSFWCFQGSYQHLKWIGCWVILFLTAAAKCFNMICSKLLLIENQSPP